MHLIIQEYKKIIMHPAKKAQVESRNLLFDKIPIIMLLRYLNYSIIFLAKNKTEFAKYIGKNNYIIELKKSKKSFF